MFAIRSAYLQRRVERRPQSRQPLRLACINEGYARQKAVEGSGPPYQVWNGKATYGTKDLLWASSRLRPKVRSTADRRMNDTSPKASRT